MYGGTKSEMERLIKDASKLTKVQQELNLTVDEGDMSFGNIVNAISVVQKQLDITGTTSKEASTTIQGSLSATKAAWENVKIAFSTGEGLEEAFDNLMEAIFGDGQTTGLVNQVLPRIAKVFESIGKYLPTIMSKLADQLPALLDALKPIFDSIKNAVVAIFTSDEFRDALSRIGSFIMETLRAGLDTVGLGGIVDAIQWLWDNRSTIVTIGEILLAAFAGSKLINGISSVADGIKNIVGGLGKAGAGAAGTGAAGAGAGSGLLAAAPIMIALEGAREVYTTTTENQKTIDGINAITEAYESGMMSVSEAAESAKEKTAEVKDMYQRFYDAPLVQMNPFIQLFRPLVEGEVDKGVSAMQSIFDTVAASSGKLTQDVEKNSNQLFKAVENSLPIPSDVANKWEELGTIAQDGSAYIADATKSNLAGIPSDVADMQAGISTTIQYGVDDVVSSLDRLRAAANDNQQQIADVADATKSTLAGVPSTVLDAMTGASSAVNYGVDDMVSSLEKLRKAASRAASSIWDVADASASSLAGVPSDVLDKMAARHYATAVDNPVIFDKPEYAMVGDGTEPEILMGISTFKAMLEQAQNTIQAQVNVGSTSASGTNDTQERQIIIPVYIGDEQIDEIVVDALRRQQYLTGGR